jgi:tRNA(Ile)-lysidine synthase
MLLEKVKQHAALLITQAAANNNIQEKPIIVLGLSGGPDSVFLFHVLQTLAQENIITLVAAHLDHQWRTESAQDALFCSRLCIQHNVPCIIAKASMFQGAVSYNGSKEEVGRNLRRLLFEHARQTFNAHFISLAHHLQDQQETFFIRLARGTSLSGLHGMNEIDRNVLRPLLTTTKQEILAFLDTNNIAYLTDPSNTSDDFLRNRIRKYVIPALHQCDQRFDQKFQTSVQKLKQEDQFLHSMAEQTFATTFMYDTVKQRYSGELNKLRTLDPVIQQRVILAWLIKEKIPFAISSNYIEEIRRFIEQPHGGSHTIGTNITLHKKQKTIWIAKE